MIRRAKRHHLLEIQQARQGHLSQLELTTLTSPTTQLYLNTLPKDVIMTVIRHLSKRPHVPYWQAYVDCTDTQNILRCGGLLMEGARDIFTELMYQYCSLGKQMGGKCTSLQVSKDAGFEQLLLELGPQLRSLSLEERQFEHDFSIEKCSQLHQLTIVHWGQASQVLDRILKSCGNSLTHLCLLGDGHMNPANAKAIARHCRVLESLSFDDKMVLANMDELWREIGRTLRQLSCFSPFVIPLSLNPSIDLEYPATVALSLVERHCTQLQDVEIQAKSPPAPIVQFYKKLATRLRVLRFKCNAHIPTPQVMQEILNECPYAVVDIHIVNHAEDMLRVLGERVRNLKVECIAEPSAQFASIANALSGLTELSVYECHSNNSLKFIKALFNAPKPNLTKLFVNRVHVFEHQHGVVMRSMNVLEVVARTVHSLREFKCYSNHPLELSSFELLLQSNRHLRCFFLDYFSDNDTANDADFELNSLRLVQSLVKYESMLEFEIVLPGRKKVLNQLRDACVPLRGRQLNLIVGAVQYLPSFFSPP